MTQSLGISSAAAHPGFVRDLESQTASQASARKFNPYATAAKMSCLALCGSAGLIATSLLASMDPTAPNPGRGLSEGGCTPKQLENVEKARKALLYSGISAASGLGAALICTPIAAGLGEGGVSIPFACLAGLGGVAFGLGASATLVAGIIYGVKKGDC